MSNDSVPGRVRECENQLVEYGYWFDPQRGTVQLGCDFWDCEKCGKEIPSMTCNVVFSAWVHEDDMDAVNRSRLRNRKLPKGIENTIRMDLLKTSTGKCHRLRFRPELAGVYGWYDEEAGDARCEDCCGTGPADQIHDTSVNGRPAALLGGTSIVKQPEKEGEK